MSDKMDQNDEDLNELTDSPPGIPSANDSSKESKDSISSNFIDKIMEFFTGFSSEERIKLKKLRDINNQIKSLKYKFYNYKKDQVQPALARKLYDIYRLTQHLARFFDINTHKKSIKLFLFDMFLNKSQNGIKEELEFEGINRLLKTSKDTKEAIEKIKISLNNYIRTFDADAVRKIDSAYNTITDMSNITSFDWLFLLRKFDAEITDMNFNYKPEFEMIEGKYVLEELVALNDYIITIDFNRDWKLIFDYLKGMSQDDNIVNVLKKFIQACKDIKKDDHLTKVIKLIYKDPFFNPKQFPSNNRIVQDYLMSFQREVKEHVDASLRQLKKDKIDTLLMSIFHKTVIVRLKYFTGRLNELLGKKGVSEFHNIDPLNYLKAFILDYCKGEIKTRIDILLIKGTWSTHGISSEYSGLLDHFNRISDSIIEFDNSLSDEETYGRTIKKLSMSVKHDNTAINTLKKVVFKMDNEAAGLINDGIKVLSYTSLKLKELVEDYKLKNPKLIIDINKIKWDFPEDLGTELTKISVKIINFVALLRYFVKTPQEAPVKDKQGEKDK